MKAPLLRHIITCCLMALLFAGCGKQLNKRVTLWRNDRIPYGTYYAYQNLQYIFDDAIIETSDQSPLSFYDSEETTSAYIIVGYSMYPDERELKAIMNHAIAGNHVFISALRIGDNLLDSFELESTSLPGYLYQTDSMTLKIYDPRDDYSQSFTYPGYELANYFTKMDSSVTKIVGRNDDGHANFVKFTYEGGGAIYLHLAPAAFSNFFLLHKNNKQYYDIALSSIPDTVDRVRWDDYYRLHTNGRDNTERSPFSKLSTFLNNEVLRWAFWLTVLLFLIIYTIESKRKQRAIPSVKKLSNTSLDFVRTIGRLYYQQKDNKNLAQKIISHFLVHVRSRYNLNTSQLDENFEERLAYKSGQPIASVKEIVNGIRELDTTLSMSDEELLTFSGKIDKFINKV